MTTFHSRQSDCDRRTRKNENTSTVNFASQIASSICAVMFTKHDKRGATIFKSLCKRTAVSKCFYRVEALPLVWTRFLRLANSSPTIARSPARRSRDGREPSGRTFGEISRALSAQLPGNSRATTTAMPPDGRADDSQDNLRAPDLAAQCPRRKLARQLTNISCSTMTFKNYEHTKHTNARF